VYNNANKLDSAFLFEQTALALFSALPFNARKYEGYALTNLGEIYQKKGDAELSRNTLIKAIDVNAKQNNLAALSYSYFSLAYLFKTINKPDSGIFYAKKSYDIYLSVDDARMYSLLSSLYEEKNNKDSAFRYLKLAGTLKDSLNDAEKKTCRHIRI
jgi:tetratricopeptide (TPR) repeat protein